MPFAKSVRTRSPFCGTTYGGLTHPTAETDGHSGDEWIAWA